MIYNRLPATGYTLVRNRLLRDPELSWKAKALHAYIASHDEAYPLTIEQVVAQGGEGKRAVQAGLSELEAAGHLVRLRRRGDRGRWIYDWHLIEPDRTPETASRSDLGKQANPQVAPRRGHGVAVTHPLEDQEEDQLEDQEQPSDASGAGPTPTGDTMTAASHDPNQLGLDGMPDAPPPKPKKVNGPHTVYLAYEAAYLAEHGKPSLRRVNWTRGEAKRLLDAGEPLEKVVAAAESMACGGNIFHSIETERRTLRDQEERQARAAANLVDGWGAAPRDFDAERVYG